MEFFLLELSYSTSGWHDIVQERASFDQRLAKVRSLIADLKGSFANFHFYDRTPFTADHPPVIVTDKFAQFGSHDLMAILAMPDKEAAHAFQISVRSFPHIASAKLTALMPWEQTINNSVQRAHDVLSTKRFSGPEAPQQ